MTTNSMIIPPIMKTDGNPVRPKPMSRPIPNDHKKRQDAEAVGLLLDAGDRAPEAQADAEQQTR